MTTQIPDIKHGILRAFSAGTYIATIQLSGSLMLFVDVPTARDIASAEMSTGRKAAVAFFDPANPNDAVCFAVWT